MWSTAVWRRVRGWAAINPPTPLPVEGRGGLSGGDAAAGGGGGGSQALGRGMAPGKARRNMVRSWLLHAVTKTKPDSMV
eukprot:scaffold1723_cov104-Isochrysis_galbana.AAC.9